MLLVGSMVGLYCFWGCSWGFSLRAMVKNIGCAQAPMESNGLNE